ncbi:hypothetical protein BDV23DRAFT_30531 [Aspergillus alliaceus]|uniref:Uncharacterized protein n=1 Tax=Petromyces alliaceus TaxID=209559 RepID=A0A5N7BSY3_PETAA|nr:hypothetical protein BDV23DRAFT_30531 [Aspergillus alliaceus]
MPGTFLSAQERHSGLVMGHRQLESSAEISREAIGSLKTAIGLIIQPLIGRGRGREPFSGSLGTLFSSFLESCT